MSILTRIEQIGNRLPQPASLFLLGTALIFVLSYLAHTMQWSVDFNGELIQANNMLSADGLWWLCAHMVENFITFPPLGIVLVGMLGIGLADRVGLLATLLRTVIILVPARLLTPATILLGILSSITLDAGYVVLPPIAAALYLAAGRSPLAGIAAVFAGIAAGFSANLSITALDPMLAGITQLSARMLVADYAVAVTANWWFMIASTVLLTLTGWYISIRFVEPNLADYTVTDIPQLSQDSDHKNQIRGLRQAGILCIGLLIGIVLLVNLPGGALYGDGHNFSRWVEATVPLLFLLFLLPGIWYGINVGKINSDRDVLRMLGESMAQLGPYIVLAFFAAQFIESFHYSGLGKMLALAGGAWLSTLDIQQSVLLSAFVMMVMCLNLLVGSASAKYALIAPIFVPMLMQVDMSPELTQAAYRVGDSISNVITPLNPYMIIILVQFQRYSKQAGLGTLIAAMLPYSIAYCIVWLALLLGWNALGLPLGPN